MVGHRGAKDWALLPTAEEGDAEHHRADLHIAACYIMPISSEQISEKASMLLDGAVAMSVHSPSSSLNAEVLSPEKIYHYTTIEGLYGILTSGKIWATNINYLNDYSEIKYANNLAIEILENHEAYEGAMHLALC